MTIALIALLASLGALGGFTAGLLGFGGGVVMFPLLLYVPALFGFADLDAKTVAAVVVAQVFFSASIAGAAHFRSGHVHRPLTLTAGLASAGGAFLGGIAAQWVSNRFLMILFGSITLLVLAMMLLPAPGKSQDNRSTSQVSLPTLPLAIFSSLTGGIAGLLGSGNFIFPPGYLDHALANASLLPQIAGAADWHINSDEPDVLDYDTTFKPPAQEALYEVNAYRTSDHDPVVVGLDLLHYNFTGFFQPVDNAPAFNSVKGGGSVPVKFSVGGNQGLDIFFNGYPLSRQIACDLSVSLDDIEQTVTAGASSLSYDATADQYSYVWKTNKAWAGTCPQLVVILKDGSIHTASFKFK